MGGHTTHLDLIRRLRAQAADVKRLTSGLDETVLATPTVAGKWSLKELICHFRRMETVFLDRIQRVLAEEGAAIAPYTDPETDAAFAALTRRPAGEVLAEYLADRETLCGLLDRLTPAEWHRKGTHPEFAHYDVHFQVEYMAHHEAHHLYQLFQRRLPLGKLPH